MENVKGHSTFASRFRELCGVKEQNELAEKFGVTKNTFRQWTNGNATPTVEKLIKLSEYFKVSTDYLLGLSEIKSPNIETQAAVLRYGLTEQALQHLEHLNKPLDIDIVEQERIATKQISTLNSPLSNDEWQQLMKIMQDKTNKQALTILNDLLTTSTGSEWETYGFQILTTIYGYCRHKFEDIGQVQHNVTGCMSYTLTADTQRIVELYRLNDIVAKFRDKLIEDGKNGKQG